MSSVCSQPQNHSLYIAPFLSPFPGGISPEVLVVSEMGGLDMKPKMNGRDKLSIDLSKLSDKTCYFVGYRRLKNMCHVLFDLEFNMSYHFIIGYHKKIVLFPYSLKDNVKCA